MMDEIEANEALLDAETEALRRIAVALNELGASQEEVNAALDAMLPHVEAVRIRHLRRHARRLDEPHAPTHALQ